MAMEILRLPPLPTARDLVRLYRLRAMKQLSQNFLLDSRLTDRIAKTAGRLSGHKVVEVGPGPGNITRSILSRGASEVVAIEKDKRFLPILEHLSDACQGRLRVVLGDVMSFDMAALFPSESRREWGDHPPDIHVIGNLPFNVSTHLIIRWLEAMSEKRNVWSYGRVPLTLTFQREVAERMVAEPMSDQRCRLSVMCQNWAQVDHRFNIPGSAFVPKPDVDVGVVHFVPLKSPQIDLPFKLVEKVLRCVFSCRRKYSRRGAETLFPEAIRGELTKEMFTIADLDPRIRAFQLTVEQFRRLCEAYHDICQRKPGIRRYNSRGPRDLRESEYLLDEDEDSYNEAAVV